MDVDLSSLKLFITFVFPNILYLRIIISLHTKLCCISIFTSMINSIILQALCCLQVSRYQTRQSKVMKVITLQNTVLIVAFCLNVRTSTMFDTTNCKKYKINVVDCPTADRVKIGKIF